MDVLKPLFESIGPMVWRCEQCPRTFTSHANLARHDRAHRAR